MTLFEYLAIAFSLVFSFSALRLVSGLPHALDPKRRYWVHTCHICTLLVNTAIVFWIFWALRDVDWTFQRFILILANPSILYFNACALVPESAGSVDSWHSYFYSVRRRYFFGGLSWAIVVAIGGTLVLEIPYFHVTRILQGLIAMASLAGIASDDPRVHAGIALFWIAISSTMALVLLTGPGLPQ